MADTAEKAFLDYFEYLETYLLDWRPRERWRSGELKPNKDKKKKGSKKKQDKVDKVKKDQKHMKEDRD